MATPSARPRVSDAVHQRLRADILNGRLAPGAAVPSERALSEELRVNRHAVREALKRLEQAGLVQISQGGATRVRDWHATAGIEVLLDLATTGEVPDASIVRSIFEMRESIGTDAVRRAASRAPAKLRQAIAHGADLTAAVAEAGDPAAPERYEEFWRSIVEASGNVAYRLALNTLLHAVGGVPGVATAVLGPDDTVGIRALGEAIAAGDPDAAVDAAQRLLEPATRWTP